MTLIGAVGVVITLMHHPRSGPYARHEKQLLEIGSAVMSAYDKQGPAALAEQVNKIESETHMRICLFRGKEGQIFGPPVSPEAAQIALMSAATGEPQHGFDRVGLWYAVPLENSYTLLAELPRRPHPPSPLMRILDPPVFGLRLSATFIIAGIVCYLLARSLTAPIFQLRKAAGLFADGVLSTRVGAALGRREDEIADLGHDFDRMAERIEALVNARQKLLRDISHELRSPLARLNVALELARQRSGAEAAKALDRIERESDRLNQLIGHLVTLTLLESGADSIEKAPVNLTLLVQDIVDDAAFEAQTRNRSFIIGPMEEITIIGSEEMLRRAVENVLRNAIRYTDEGTAVEVGLLLRENEKGNYAVIRVKDEGPGVPEAALAQLFQPFYRVAEARDRLTGGTGIGLAITERSVHLHGGTARASNDPAGGLVVEILLPVTGALPILS